MARVGPAMMSEIRSLSGEKRTFNETTGAAVTLPPHHWGRMSMSLQKPAGQPSPSVSSAKGAVGPLRLFGRTVMTKPTPNDRVTAEQSDVVLFGLDETGKPRAARFSGEHIDLAAKAAGLMNLAICYVNSAELARDRATAAGWPHPCQRSRSCAECAPRPVRQADRGIED